MTTPSNTPRTMDPLPTSAELRELSRNRIVQLERELAPANECLKVAVEALTRIATVKSMEGLWANEALARIAELKKGSVK